MLTASASEKYHIENQYCRNLGASFYSLAHFPRRVAFLAPTVLWTPCSLCCAGPATFLNLCLWSFVFVSTSYISADDKPRTMRAPHCVRYSRIYRFSPRTLSHTDYPSDTLMIV
eukprot:6212773-Pleurochrysis_carterae.AAC.3